MIKYFSNLCDCNELHNKNKIQEEHIRKLQKQLEELQYKYDGVELCKKEVYDKYKECIIRKSLK